MQHGDCALHAAFGGSGEELLQKGKGHKSANQLDTMQVVQTMWRGRNGRRTHTLEFVSKISAGTLITHCNPTIETLLENFLDPKRKDVECSRSVNMQLRFSPIQHPA